MKRLKVANDEKLTELGRKFHTFIALLSSKKVSTSGSLLPQRGLNNFYMQTAIEAELLSAIFISFTTTHQASSKTWLNDEITTIIS